MGNRLRVTPSLVPVRLPPIVGRMLAKEERKKLAAERCAGSVIWRSVYALGSLDLAILLLLSLAGVCAVATFLESGFSARVARAYVYNAPWFNVWLLLLYLS